MLNRYIFLGVFFFFLMLFGFLIFWVPEKSSTQENEKEIVWIEKPSFILLKDLKSNNPVHRREAITKLGEKRVKRAIKPLFDILMSSDYPLYEKQLAAKSVALITGQPIIPRVLRILEQMARPQSGESDKVGILSMLYILKNIEMIETQKTEYDFSVINYLLSQSQDNDIILNTIQVIENLGYSQAFYSLGKIYSRNLFYKIAVLKAMTKLAMKNEKHAAWLQRFLNNIVWEESHASIQQTIREAFFTIAFKRKPEKKESAIIALLSDLSSPSFKKVLEAEAKLLAMHYDSRDIPVLRFFLQDVNPLVTNRLLNIVIEKKLAPKVKEELDEIIKKRYNPIRNYKDVALDSARKALLALNQIPADENHIQFLVANVQDYFLGGQSLESLGVLLKKGEESDQIAKKSQYLNVGMVRQKHFLFPFLHLLSALQDEARVQRTFCSADPYVKYNTLNFALKQKLGSKALVEIARKYQDPVIQSIVGHYERSGK